jgi:hypothetical protein
MLRSFQILKFSSDSPLRYTKRGMHASITLGLTPSKIEQAVTEELGFFSDRTLSVFILFEIFVTHTLGFLHII